MDRSASAVTLVFAVSELFEWSGSLVEESTDAVLAMVVPVAVFDFTWIWSEKVALSPEAMDEVVQVTVPFVPTAGVEQLHPDGVEMDTNTVCEGSASVILAEAAASGPWLCTVMLYGMDAPGETDPEPVVLETERSAEVAAARLGLAAASTSAVMTKNAV